MFRNKFKISKKDLKKTYFANEWYTDYETKFEPNTINIYHKLCVRVIPKFELMMGEEVDDKRKTRRKD